MARFVREVMNRELFSVGPEDHVDDVLDSILEYGITAVPILDDERRPIGMTSIRDLLGDGRGVVKRPVATTRESSEIDEAARAMAESGRHHLVVVDDDGRAIGMVSSLDLLRAVLGLPASHPSTFPHRDRESGCVFTDPRPLDREHADAAPDDAGVFVLSVGGVRREEVDVWAEASPSLRTRIAELVELPCSDSPALARVLAMHDLRFRCAVVADVRLRDGIAEGLQHRISRARLPRPAAIAS